MIKKILMMVLLLAPLSLCAQKIAHYNYAEIAQSLPETKAAMADLQKLGQEYQKNIDDMKKEFSSKLQKYQQTVNTQTPKNIRERNEQELNEMQQKIQQAIQDNQQAFAAAQQKKMTPIDQKIKTAAQAVAKEGGYAMIIDDTVAQNANMILNTTLVDNVTAKIKAKLGVVAATKAKK